MASFLSLVFQPKLGFVVNNIHYTTLSFTEKCRNYAQPSIPLLLGAGMKHLNPNFNNWNTEFNSNKTIDDIHLDCYH